ncbi:myrosinase 1-like [Tribolium madens]|uniref:myrosinase 1-like n=1 Tax=Tribolium madens TaxID=41895 RepID=UPI001CF728CF|nr:myrosinase 1-like [Tribolium madens]
MKLRLLFLATVFLIGLDQSNSASKNKFPDYFKFGVATASYQVEGGWDADGKGENVWDHITHTNPNYVKNQDNGDIACDSYHKYKEDVALMKDMGIDYYRFSISWSRILPYGIAGSPLNQLGIDHYRNLTQELLDNGIEPMVTMFHWDTPEPLQELGGWPNPEMEEHFVYYARILFEQLGDLVKMWMTFNEAKQTCLEGYGTGEKAPGFKTSGLADYQCAHTILKSHAKVYHMYEEEFREKQGGRVGIVIDSMWFEPGSGSDKDVEAAERARQFTYGWYGNPIIHGNYPQVMIDRIGERSKKQGFAKSRLPTFTQEEIDYIKGTYDFVALNTYSTNYTAWIEEADISDVSYNSDLNVRLFVDDSWEESASTWLRVVPWGLRKIVNWLSKTYNNPEIFITENGLSDRGGLDDDQRIRYYRDYLSNLVDAIVEDGVNVTRYTAWSLLDNFEWRSGYTEKFGFYSVDFNSTERTRTKKASADYYSKVISTRCLVDTCN